jgi:hypothetical protein
MPPTGRNEATRRGARYGLVAIAALVVLFGGYSAYWAVVAERIETGIAAWALSERERQVDASWRALGVAGFPVAFRIELKDAALRDRSVEPAPEVRVSALSGRAAAWDLGDWRLDAPAGLTGRAGTGGRPPLRLLAPRADGAVHLGAAGGGTLWLRLPGASVEGSGRVRIGAALLWITLPSQPPRGHTEPNFGLAVDLHAVELPAAARALGDGIEELAFGITVKGALPSGNLVRSLAAWRDAGGTVELDNLDLRWGGLGATATGTMALDQELQPIGGFSGAIEGYDRILRALVQAGRMPAGEAGLAQLALTLLAKAGPDGRPQIATSFTIQNGQMFLGPAKLGPAPRLIWQ